MKQRPRPRTSSKSSPGRIAAARRSARALELRSRGYTFKRIAAELGYSGKQGAHDAVMRALDATVREPADEFRRLDLERLDRLWRGFWPRAMAGEVRATNVCLQIMDRRARLLGLYLPVRVETRFARDDGITSGVVVDPEMPV
jgi:hypothetical protein